MEPNAPVHVFVCCVNQWQLPNNCKLQIEVITRFATPASVALGASGGGDRRAEGGGHIGAQEEEELRARGAQCRGINRAIK